MALSATTADHYCLFEVDHSTFAVSALQIREIAVKPNFARTPCSSPTLAGLWHEGSEFLPILRLPFQADLNPDLEQQVLVVHGSYGRWGLLVNQVLSVVEIEYAQTEAASDTEWSSALLGMSTWEDRSVHVLHLDGVYRLVEQNLKQHWDAHLLTPMDLPKLSPSGQIA